MPSRLPFPIETARAAIADGEPMCSNAWMDKSKYAAIPFAALTAVALLNSCNRPISDDAKLKAIRAEAQALLNTHPPQQRSKWRKVSKEQWPATIAALHPENVTVHTWGVEIVIQGYFDGGYGYEVPRTKSDLPMPAACYSEPSQGVFWHGPC
jgi:hypothetical protein